MSHPSNGPSAGEHQDSADLSGRQVGNFRFLRRLGRGAMAEVYLAEQCALKRWVAVKILKPELANDPTALKRFQREAQAAASLVHANIVQIYEVGQADGLHYIAQEYVQGQNLRDWMLRHGPPDLNSALAILRQVVAALAKAAEHDVVHRDIKPENILLTAGGEVKVVDFGLARVLREAETDLTQVGITMGTPLYMSPEQVEGRPLDPRSDLYSLGVTCYHLLTGKPPFVGETALAVAVQHVKREPPPLQSVRPDLPPAMCRAVHRMLAKAPEERWQSPQELLAELYRIRLENDPAPSAEELAPWESIGLAPVADWRIQTSRQLQQAMQVPPPPRKRRRWLLAGSMIAVFLLSGLIGWLRSGASELLPPDEASAVRIPRQRTAPRQWYYASQLGTAEAWQSVIEYFPDNACYVCRARQQLARVYLAEKDYDHALAVFEELADVPDSDTEFKAYGLAGKGGILTLQGKYRESAAALDALWPICRDLRDAQMREWLKYTIRENRANLGAHTTREWREWLNEEYGRRPEG